MQKHERIVIHIRICPELNKKIKIWCVENNSNMQKYVSDLIEKDFIEKKE